MNTTEPSLPGIDVLNAGFGDCKLSFDPNKPDEVQNAKETITDMLQRGYAIFINLERKMQRLRVA